LVFLTLFQPENARSPKTRIETITTSETGTLDGRADSSPGRERFKVAKE
jgi:hypothetical protein